MTEIIDEKTYNRWFHHSFQQNCTNTAVRSSTGYYQTFNGQRTKSSKYSDWRERLLRGEICTNNYSRVGYMFNHSPSSINWTAGDSCGTKKIGLQGYRYGTANNSPPSSLSLPNDYGVALATATARFAAQVSKAQTHMSGMVFAGELKKTLETIRRPAKGVDNLINAYLNSCSRLRRKYRRKVSQGVLQNDIIDNWLEYAFGWAPLIAETQNAAEALSRLIHDKRPHIQVRGFATVDTHNISNPARISVAGGLLEGTSFLLDETSVSVSIRGAVRAKASGPLWRSTQLFGFQASEFVPTIWNLIPMSWVTDYFSNVGDILSATYTDFSGLYWDSLTRKATSSRSYKESSFVKTSLAKSSFNGGGSGGSWILKRQSMSRERLESRIPELVFNFPGNPNQIINLSAVLLKSKNISFSLSGLLK